MADNIHIYGGNPTANGTDGTRLDSSVQGSVGSLTVKLNSLNAEEKNIKLAVRTDSGYYIDGACTVSLTGSSAHYWELLYNSSYETATSIPSSATGWDSSLSLTNVSDKNKVFWLKATSTSGESATIDSGAGLVASGLVGVQE